MEDETTGVPEEELVEEPTDDLAEEEEETFSVRVFFHTGAALLVALPFGSTVLDMRKKLEDAHNRATYGSIVLLDGQQVDPDDEKYVVVEPGQIATFTGTVKGG